jgi:hypothetical protein
MDARADARDPSMSTGGSHVGRSEAARILGCTRSTIVRMERAGALRAIVDEHGHHAFDRDELGLVAARRERRGTRTASSNTDAGSLAARAFKLFTAGARLAEVVVKLRVEPTRVRELHRDWCTFRRPADMLLSSGDQVELGAILGDFRTPQDLLACVGTKLGHLDETIDALHEIADLFGLDMKHPNELVRELRVKQRDACVAASMRSNSSGAQSA